MAADTRLGKVHAKGHPQGPYLILPLYKVMLFPFISLPLAQC